MLNKINKNGFSLIELIIVISIITIFISISVSIYRNSVNEHLFQEDVNLVVSILEQTKQRTIARDTSPQVSCTTFESYNLLINPSNNIIIQEFQCDGIITNLNIYEMEWSTINSPSVETRLEFTSPYGNLSSAIDQTISLRSPSIEKCINIIIPIIGTITVSDPFSC